MTTGRINQVASVNDLAPGTSAATLTVHNTRARASVIQGNRDFEEQSGTHNPHSQNTPHPREQHAQA